MPAFLVGADGIDRGRYTEFFNVYARSEHGLHHAGQPLRYASAFGCDDRDQMQADLGDDVHPVLHMLETERTFIELMRLQYGPSARDVHDGRVTALVHDLGENTHHSLLGVCGAVVGDIPQGKKTPELRAAEMRVWDFLMARHYSGKIPDEQIARARQLVMHQGHGSRFGLQDALDAAHDVNTLRVGLRAGDLALRLLYEGDDDSARFESLRAIGLVVTRDIAERVERYGRSFALPDRVLTDAESLYDRIQAEL